MPLLRKLANQSDQAEDHGQHPHIARSLGRIPFPPVNNLVWKHPGAAEKIREDRLEKMLRRERELGEIFIGEGRPLTLLQQFTVRQQLNRRQQQAANSHGGGAKQEAPAYFPLIAQRERKDRV